MEGFGLDPSIPLKIPVSFMLCFGNFSFRNPLLLRISHNLPSVFLGYGYFLKLRNVFTGVYFCFQQQLILIHVGSLPRVWAYLFCLLQ